MYCYHASRIEQQQIDSSHNQRMGDGRAVDKAIKFEEDSQPTRPRCVPTSNDPSDSWRERESSMVGVQRMRDPLRTLPNGGHTGTDGTHDHDMGEILRADLRSDFSRPPRVYRMGSDDMECERGQQPTDGSFRQLDHEGGAPSINPRDGLRDGGPRRRHHSMSASNILLCGLSLM